MAALNNGVYHSKPICAALTKQGQRFLSSIAMSPSSEHLLSKFVSSSSKAVALSTLTHLLSTDTTHPHLSSLALPLYMKITQVPWFSWNSKLVSSVIASLYKQGRIQEAETLISETISTMCLKERDLVSFYCNLINAVAKVKSKIGFAYTHAHLTELLCTSSSAFVRKRAYESLVGGLCVMGLPQEAENLIKEMEHVGLKPSLFEFRSLIEGYGRLGLFEEMLQSVSQMENSGFPLDTISSNMVLSSYGLHSELTQMVYWLQKMKALGISLSIRTYNSVLNSCQTFRLLLQDLKSVPIALKDLILELGDGEALLVQELAGTQLLDEMMTWNSLESELDLHGMHLSTAYLVMLLWMEEVRLRFNDGKYEIPGEMRVVCGIGKHSSIRGDSPVKGMVREILVRAGSPLRIDRKNTGCFIAKGKTVVNWLC
ncbi:hypothetical protein KSS87_014125 [Heliosperma pusillum]|nr:hypothetical protein KSS87_014125 [Heliosperma pusillum]